MKPAGASQPGPGPKQGPGPKLVPPGTPVGLGLDLVDMERFRRVLGRRPSMWERLYTEGEAGYARTFADPVPSLAARFAAKEAVMKALGVGLGAFAFTDVEVRRLPTGQPFLELSGGAHVLATEACVGTWLLSLTHTASTAAAVALALA
ncbi:MAG TPA: holo-ACP synthase [Acidimicrobiales bacterium]|nr:holo-ACP synthase [Acidimicrobiales bacterium]